MDDLRDLYQETLLDHYRHPRNHGKLGNANRHAEGFNPLCGDKVVVYMVFRDGVIEDVAFEGAACAICTASTSIMTEIIKRKTLPEIEQLFGQFHDLVTSAPGSDVDAEALGKLAIFSGVREFPIRVKCATLPWHTMHSAIRESDETATTE